MTCYKSGGCGVYENRSCSECPASKPEYLKRNMEEYIKKSDVLEMLGLPPDILQEYIYELKGVWIDENDRFKMDFPETIKRYVEGANDFAEYAKNHHRGVSIYDYEIENILIKFLKQFCVIKEATLEDDNISSDEKIKKALDIAWEYGQIDGAHHKAWVIDQMVKALYGNEEKYEKWVEAYETPDGEDYYEWDTGIAP